MSTENDSKDTNSTETPDTTTADESTISVDEAKKVLLQNGLQVLSDSQIGSIKSGVKQKYKPLEEELEGLKSAKVELENQLKEIRQANMSDAEKKEAEYQEILDSHASLKDQYSQLEAQHKQLLVSIRNKDRDSALLDILSEGSEDASLSVREAIHAFPNLDLKDGALVITDKTTGAELDPDTTKAKIQEWFQGKPVLHKRQSTGPKGGMKTTTPPGEKPPKFDPYSKENREALKSSILNFNKQ